MSEMALLMGFKMHLLGDERNFQGKVAGTFKSLTVTYYSFEVPGLPIKGFDVPSAPNRAFRRKTMTLNEIQNRRLAELFEMRYERINDVDIFIEGDLGVLLPMPNWTHNVFSDRWTSVKKEVRDTSLVTYLKGQDFDAFATRNDTFRVINAEKGIMVRVYTDREPDSYTVEINPHDHTDRPCTSQLIRCKGKIELCVELKLFLE